MFTICSWTVNHLKHFWKLLGSTWIQITGIHWKQNTLKLFYNAAFPFLKLAFLTAWGLYKQSTPKHGPCVSINTISTTWRFTARLHRPQSRPRAGTWPCFWSLLVILTHAHAWELLACAKHSVISFTNTPKLKRGMW